VISNKIEAKASAAAAALQFICSFYGFAINEHNSRQAQSLMEHDAQKEGCAHFSELL